MASPSTSLVNPQANHAPFLIKNMSLVNSQKSHAPFPINSLYWSTHKQTAPPFPLIDYTDQQTSKKHLSSSLRQHVTGGCRERLSLFIGRWAGVGGAYVPN